MQKKLTAGMIILLSALAVFLGWYSFTGVLIITIPVILICEDETLRKNVLNAFFYALIFLVVGLVLSKLSSWYMSLIGKLYAWDALSKIFTAKVYGVFVKLDFAYYLNRFLDFVQFVVMVIFVILAFMGKEVKIPIANSLANKVLGIVVPKKEKEDKKDDKKEDKEEEKKEENPLTSDKATLTEIPKDWFQNKIKQK